MTDNNIWSEIFGFSIGNKVKVIKVTDTACCPLLTRYLGEIGRVHKIKEAVLVNYYDKQTFFEITAPNQKGRIVNIYLVLFDNGEDYWFAVEDLELVET